MKVVLESSRINAWLKGCLWMCEDDENSEGGQNEDGKPLKSWTLHSIIKSFS